MRGVDLSIFRFHYDLTFCALLMNADGTTYHVYGGRDHEDAEKHLSLETLAMALESGLKIHSARLPRVMPAEPPMRTPRSRTPEALPFIEARLAKRKNECIHCHTVTDALHERRRTEGTFTEDDLWEYPEPQTIGLVMDPDAPCFVQEVRAGSPAARAGVRAGDLLAVIQDIPRPGPDVMRKPGTLALGVRVLRTFGDLVHALDLLPAAGGTFRLVLARSGADPKLELDLELEPGWRKQTPAEFAWRPALWRLRPQPGFGGPELDAEQKKARGLEEDAFAFRIQYLVTWGERAHVGRSARKAGLRKNDVVLSVGGKSDFESTAHFHAWFRFTRKAGETLKVEVLRGKKKLTLDLPVVP